MLITVYYQCYYKRTEKTNEVQQNDNSIDRTRRDNADRGRFKSEIMNSTEK